jgi:hypothetical protein
MLSIRIMLGACLLLITISCAQTENKNSQKSQNSQSLNPIEQQFLNNILTLNGKSFLGKEVFTIEGRENWQGVELRISINQSESGDLLIPLEVGDDKSRTWMFINENGRLRFRHNHQYPDGTPHEVTLYGGYADGNGTALVQRFPADEYTCKLIDYACKNEWTVEIADNFTKLIYELRLDGHLRFTVEFDLSKPI